MYSSNRNGFWLFITNPNVSKNLITKRMKLSSSLFESKVISIHQIPTAMNKHFHLVRGAAIE